jgi:hypothetical protein
MLGGVEAVEANINSPTSVLPHYLSRKRSWGAENYSGWLAYIPSLFMRELIFVGLTLI